MSSKIISFNNESEKRQVKKPKIWSNMPPPNLNKNSLQDFLNICEFTCPSQSNTKLMGILDSIFNC